MSAHSVSRLAATVSLLCALILLAGPSLVSGSSETTKTSPATLQAWTGWRSLGKPSGVKLESLTFGRNEDGRMELFAQGVETAPPNSYDIYHAFQSSSGTWGGWSKLGNPSVNLYSPVVASNEDRRIEVFALALDSSLNWPIYSNRQAAVNDGWGGWLSLDRPSGVQLSYPAVGVNLDGRLEVFSIGDDHNVWHRWEATVNDGWNANWVSLSKPSGTNAKSISVGRNQDGRLEVFAPGADNVLYHIWQVSPGGGWSTWQSMGKPAGVNIWSENVAVERNSDGRMELFVTGTDGAMWHRWQTTPNGTWGDWSSLSYPPGTSLRNHVVGRYQDKGLGVFAVDILSPNGNIWHRQQVNTSSGAVWGGWFSFGAPSPSAMSYLAVGVNDDARMELFGVTADGTAWNATETDVKIYLPLAIR